MKKLEKNLLHLLQVKPILQSNEDSIGDLIKNSLDFMGYYKV